MSSYRVCAVLVMFLAFAFPVRAEAFGHYWSYGFGTGLLSDAAVDATGNIVVIGEYFTSIDFGGGPLPTPDLYGDACIAKFTASGAHLWSKNIGGFDAQLARFVRIDPDGDIVIAVEFLSEIDFGGTVHEATGHVDIYLAKLDPNGNRIWSKNFGDAGNNSGISGLGIDDLGSVYLAAWGGDIDYGGGPLSLDADVHIVKFDPAGNHVWSYGHGHAWPNLAGARSLAVDPTGNVTVTGDFEGTVDFGGPTLTSVGSDDIFLVRFDANGAHLWSQGFGDAGSHPLQIVGSNDAGGSYLTVELAGSIDFGGGQLTSVGGSDIFLAKFDGNGAHVWSKRFGDASGQSARTMAVTPAGEVFLAGTNTGTLNFGSGPLLSNGSFLARFSSAGSHVSSQDFGNSCTPMAVAVDPWANPIMAGDKNGATDFGGGPIAQIGSTDIFLVRFAPTTTAVSSSSRNALDVRAFPNPFNPGTTITYRVPAPGRASVRVFDAAGRLVETLVDGELRTAGSHVVDYRARGSSGVYFVRVDTGGESVTTKVVLLK